MQFLRIKTASNNRKERSVPKTEKLTLNDIQAVIENSIYYQPEGTTLTICVLILTNGFTTVGESACINPADFDAEMGKQLAYRDAETKIWRLEGYLRKQAAYDAAHTPPPLVEIPTVIVAPHDDLTSFIGVKIVNAKPMTRAVYNQLRGWQLPPDENGDDAGYLVEYTDAQRPNVEGFKGYVSWSPKDVFEGAYHTFTNPPAPEPATENLGDAVMTGGDHSETPLPFSG
uniref:Phage protein n=1 Tax=Mycena chlorophos TaxID=658473 RepID=A0ABQ0KU02_MYCCL|nr:predicted protein [Mycena chlorophos]